jgi:hypothetical protein
MGHSKQSWMESRDDAIDGNALDWLSLHSEAFMLAFMFYVVVQISMNTVNTIQYNTSTGTVINNDIIIILYSRLLRTVCKSISFSRSDGPPFIRSQKGIM